MNATLLPLGLVVAFGSALTLRLLVGHGTADEAQPVPASRSEMNREIERRLDLAVNGPCPIPPADASPYIPRPQPCSSPEPWRARP